MTPYPHQIELANKGIDILREHMMVYLACEERTGKTLASIMIAERIHIQDILVLTKKNAIGGWTSTLGQYKGAAKNYTVTNYHQAPKLYAEYDLVILDEAHNYISSFPKKSKLWEAVKILTNGVPLIYLSATPFAQGPQLLYHQFALSDWSPWRQHKTAYAWFGSYGIPESIWVEGRQVPIYTNVEDTAYESVKHLFITQTREEIGFEFEPKDEVHFIELNKPTRTVYNTLMKDKAINLNNHDLVCDTTMKLRSSLHMLEGGVAIINEVVNKKQKRTYLQLGNTEKIDYIKDTWGDHLGLVIMYNYKAEGTKLQEHFSLATLLQATSYAEGIDLSMYDHLVIYSQDFSTARHTQRRARQANKLRGTDIIVHYLLVKDAISHQVYKTVSINKQNYIDRLYEPIML